MKTDKNLQEIYQIAKKGSKNEENVLFSFLYVRFSTIAKYRIGGGDIEDIAQEACLTVLEKYKDLSPDVVFEAWAYQVLRNKIGSYLRSSNVRKVVHYVDQIESYGQEKDFIDLFEFKRAIISCLKKLKKYNPRYLKILNLIIQGYKTDEICEKLTIKPNNFYVLLFRSRKLLYDCMYTTKEKK